MCREDNTQLWDELDLDILPISSSMSTMSVMHLLHLPGTCSSHGAAEDCRVNWGWELGHSVKREVMLLRVLQTLLSQRK